jgi:4-diphosphocytidyl-2-C-methyl-D-erythritol kinase
MQVLAPAKINLSLRILGRRPDGFHEIESLIAPISLYDELTIDKQSRWIDFICDDTSIPDGEENLVVRAAKVFFQKPPTKGGVSIALHKLIPHGAGLGGGSSDAAATLLALDQLFETKLAREELAKLGATIGSDVPLFIFQTAAICKGRGELVAPSPLRQRLSILLLKPAFGVSSAWAYAHWQNSKQIPGVLYEPQKFADQILANDLERPVFEKFVFLAQLKMWLLRQPEVGAALMSGSGSTIFALMRSGAEASVLAARAQREVDPQLWTCGCQTLG